MKRDVDCNPCKVSGGGVRNLFSVQKWECGRTTDDIRCVSEIHHVRCPEERAQKGKKAKRQKGKKFDRDAAIGCPHQKWRWWYHLISFLKLDRVDEAGKKLDNTFHAVTFHNAFISTGP